MSTWAALEAEAPELAARVRTLFQAGTNKTIATLRLDGSPRISGTELDFVDGEITFGMMPNSRKLDDVTRDPRVAVHSPTLERPGNDPSEWPGDAKFSGSLRRSDPPSTAAVAEASYFTLDITEAVLTYVEGDSLIVESWHPGRGWTRFSRK